MTKIKGEQRCCICMKRKATRRTLLADYDGPAMPAAGHYAAQKVCGGCVDFCTKWIEVGPLHYKQLYLKFKAVDAAFMVEETFFVMEWALIIFFPGKKG